jgi:hypothetical protein
MELTVCTGPKGEPVLADDRGAANLILRQMTAVFGRLHNFAVEQFRSDFSDPGNLFRSAKRKVQRQFQWLVCEDYLRSILDPTVHKTVFVHQTQQFEWKRFSIPIEFAAAAMRFGHAMVRPNYLFSFGHDMLLPNVFGRKSQRGPIDREREFNGDSFFEEQVLEEPSMRVQLIRGSLRRHMICLQT